MKGEIDATQTTENTPVTNGRLGTVWQMSQYQ